MEKIKSFLDTLIKAEEMAHTEHRKEDNMEVYNQSVDDLNSFTHLISEDFSGIGFNVHKMDQPHNEEFWEELPLLEEISSRTIYKISHYHNNTYGDLWACYLSIANAYMGVQRIHECFIVVPINGELKIIAQFGNDIDRPANWRLYGGDRNLKMYDLGKLITIERFIEPKDDAWSMEQYNKEI